MGASKRFLHSLSAMGLCLIASGCEKSDGSVVVGEAALALRQSAEPEVVGFKLLSRYVAPTGPAAEIIAASPDGSTLVFTNGVYNTVDFLDITDPADPVLTASVDVRNTVTTPGAGAVTSVAVTPNGRYAVAAVLDASAPSAANPGALVFIDVQSPAAGIVGRINIGIGPDSLKITPDGLRAVVAIEDEATSGARPGSIEIVRIDYDSPSASSVVALPVVLTVGNNQADPQPEFVDISKDGTFAIVSLQENNLVAVVDLVSEQIADYLDAGTVSRIADFAADSEIALDDAIIGRREPDSICMLADGAHFVTANEGDTSASGGQVSGARGFTIFGVDGSVVYESADALEQLAVTLGQYPDTRSAARGIEVEGCATGVFGEREYAFLLGERNSSVSVVDVSVPSSPEIVQMLPAPFRPEGAVAIGSRNLFAIAGEGPNGGAANDEFLGGGVWIYEGVSEDDDVQAFPQDVLQAYTNSLPFGGISGATWNGERDQLIATADSAFAKQRIWTFEVEREGEHERMKLASELLLTDASGAQLTGYDPEGITVNPAGGYILASEGTARNGGTAAGTCTNANPKNRNRLLFFTAAGRLDAAYGGGDGIVELPCAAAGEPNGIDWSRVTGNGFEGVAAVDSRPRAAGGVKVYAVIQRPLSAGDPAGLTRIGEYDVDSDTWSFYFYRLDSDLAGARNAIVLSEITYLGGDAFAILERDQRRTGSSSVKRIYTVHLSTGARNDSADPLDKVLAVDLLATPFRFDFEKVESIAITPHGTYVINDNDGGDEAVLFYRIEIQAGATRLPLARP